LLNVGNCSYISWNWESECDQ